MIETSKPQFFEGKKFKGGALIVLDFPIISKNFTLSPGIEYFEILSYPQSERGIDSDPDRTLYLLGEKGYIFNGEVSYYMFERQLEFFYTYFKFDYDPYGYVDYDDNFIISNRRSSELIKIDRLTGLKENVIVGRLIPAGTGSKVRQYKKTAFEKDKEILALVEKKSVKKSKTREKQAN